MKPSKFNFFFKQNNHFVGFNSYSQEFILVEPILFELYECALKTDSFFELKKVHINFYRFLIKKNFIVENSINEFEKTKAKFFEIDNDDSHFELIVNPTMNCNFKCWYCYETHIKDSKMNLEVLNSVIDFASNVINNKENLNTFILSYFGGEPLLYFDKVIVPSLKEISRTCKEKKINFLSSMTTNGLLINQEMLTICKEYGVTSFQITLDGNREQHNKVRFISQEKGSYDKIVQNIILSIKNKIFVTVRINCSEITMKDINQILDDFSEISDEEKSLLNFDFQKVWQEQTPIDDILDETRLVFNKNGFSVTGIGHNIKQQMNTCYADKRNQATINYNGEVFKCTARDFKDNSGEGILHSDGTIAWNHRYEKRMNIKFNNAPCKECKILPICGGGCSQHALENENHDYCIYNFDEKAKEQMIINRFKNLLLN